MCAAVCGRQAIRIELSEEGFYRPVVDAAACVDCGLCTRVCYRFDPEPAATSETDLGRMPLYAASARDEALLRQTTSGGVADLLARRLLADGYRCVGVRYDDAAARAEHVVCDTPEGLDAFRGSKYIQSYTLNAFRELAGRCRWERFAVFGTPCQIYAVHRYLSLRGLRDRCVLVDLYCHGCPSLHVWHKYQREVKALVRQPRFDRVDFRSKVKGWGSFHISAYAGEERVFTSSPRRDAFYELFFSDMVLGEACHDCRLRSTLAYTDIRLGDFWGKRYVWNHRGVSAVSLCTERGREVFEAIRPQLDCRPERYADFLPWQSWGHTYHPQPDVRQRMLASLGDASRPLSVAVAIFRAQQGWKGRLKRRVKALAYYLPPFAVSILKRWA